MSPRDRSMLAGGALVTAACVLAACGNAPSPRGAPGTTTSTTTTSTTMAPPPTTALSQDVGVPNVVGMKIALARFYLRTAGFATVALDTACNKGTPASQSVVASLSVPGRPPNVTVGAQPLVPGTLLPKGARVGITWSGCYPEGAQVPLVIGHTFPSAVHLLHLAGLDWACYSVGSPTTTTSALTTPTSAPTTTTASTPKPPQTVLSQGIKSGAVVHADSVVSLFMHRCPQ